MGLKVSYLLLPLLIAMSPVGSSTALPDAHEISHLLDFIALASPQDLSANISGLNEDCATHWKDFLLRLSAHETGPFDDESFWALKMYDAFGKQPIEGRYQGSLWAIGSPESCRGVYAEQPHPLLDHGSFQGKYCYAWQTYDFNNISGISQSRLGDGPPFLGPFPYAPSGLMTRQSILARLIIKQGVCFPDSCSRDDVQLILDDYAASVSGPLINYTYYVNGCDGLMEPDFTTGDILMIVVFAIFAFLLCAGLLLDIFYRYRRIKATAGWEIVLVGCSPYTNLIAFNAQPKKNMDHITSINGIRFFSMSWVVLCHLLSDIMYFLPLNNYVYLATDFVDDFGFRAIWNGFPSVDSFYVMSGMLVGYLTFKELDRSRGRLNLFVFYIHRYIRLTGVYAVIVMFHATLLRFMPHGDHSVAHFYVQACRDNWWYNLLYVNNFWPSNCMGQTWYMATDMQMFWASPLMMVPMWWIWKKFGKVWTAVWAAAWVVFFTVLLLILQIVNEWPMSQILDQRHTDYVEDNYIMPWTRCQPYIVGIITGFILHRLRGRTIEMPRWMNLGLWLIAFGGGLSVIYGVDTYATFSAGEPSAVANAFFGVLNRLVWGICLSWLIFACSKGYGGWINRLLSWEAFGPLSKLTYAMYLLHFTMLTMLLSPISYRLEFTPYYLANLFIAFMFYVTAASLVTHIGLEVPLLNGDKVLFKWLFSLGGRKKAN